MARLHGEKRGSRLRRTFPNETRGHSVDELGLERSLVKTTANLPMEHFADTVRRWHFSCFCFRSATKSSARLTPEQAWVACGVR